MGERRMRAVLGQQGRGLGYTMRAGLSAPACLLLLLFLLLLLLLFLSEEQKVMLSRMSGFDVSIVLWR